MNNREEILDIIAHTPCVAVSSKTAAEHILDNLISHGILFNENKPNLEKIAENILKSTHYRYDVNGYTGEIILSGDHTDDDIKLAIMDDLNCVSYEQI